MGVVSVGTIGVSWGEKVPPEKVLEVTRSTGLYSLYRATGLVSDPEGPAMVVN